MYQYSRRARGGYWGGTGLDRMALGSRENFLRMQETGAPRFGKDIPVDILYGMPQDIYTEPEDLYESESRKWQERYPKRAREVQKIVEEECDRMDYAGSFLYDEYPDQILLKRMEDTIYRIILDRHLFDDELIEEIQRAEDDAEDELSGMQLLVRRPCGRNDWLCEMIQIILYQEMAKRRCRGRWC